MAGHRELIDEGIIRDMSEGVMTINLNGIVDSFNPAAEQILDSMVRDGALDGEMLAEFRESRAWEQVCS